MFKVGVERHVKRMTACTVENAWITTMFMNVTAARLHFMDTSVIRVRYSIVQCSNKIIIKIIHGVVHQL